MPRRIATATAAVDLFGTGKNGFRAGNPAANLLPTQLSATWFNEFQETILDPIEEAGLVANSDTTTLTQAIALLSGIGVATTVSTTTTLTRGQRGIVQANASAANVDITLPAADRVLDFLIRRVDNTGNRLRVYAAGTDVILHNAEINAGAGYPFIRLFGAGDFWMLRSDGAGNWIPYSRLAAAPVGSLIQHSANLYPSGGFGPVHGTLLVRSDYPWLWDLANASSNIDTEANWSTSKWGGYSTGDTATTFRVLELRGEFIRVWDDSRSIDSGRAIGSFADHQVQDHDHNLPYGTGTVIATSGTPVMYDGGSANKATSAPTTGNHGTETRPRSIALPMLLKLI